MPEEKPKEAGGKAAKSEAAEKSLDLDIPKPDVPVNPLEVEEMPESGELQKRRQMMKEKLREVADEVDEKDGGDAFQDTDSSGFWDILKESGLSARHFKFCCGGIVIVGLIAALGYGALKAWDYYRNRQPAQTPVETPVENPSNELFDSQIEVGIKIGFEQAEKDSSTSSGEELGTQKSSNERFARFVEDFQEIYNSLQVDVQALLNQSNDRALALDKYVAELEKYNNIAQLNLRELQREDGELVAQFKAIDEDKSTYEQDFFDHVNELNGDASAGSLEQFIDAAKQATGIRANYRARSKLEVFYKAAIEKLDLRLKDIQFNKEALVKGVQVVEIAGSDLNLIVDGSAL